MELRRSDSVTPLVILRPYQSLMITAARAAFADGARRVLLTAPTGSGKTVMFCEITSAARVAGNRVLILVHRDELLDQVSSTLRMFGVPHAVIASGQPLTHAPVQVASVFTLARRLDNAPTFDLIIIDECHHAVAGSWARVIDHYANAWLLGVTATPIRLDGRGLGSMFTTLVPGPDIRELTDSGWLVPARVLAPPSQISTQGVATKRGDFDKTQLATEANTITGDAVAHYIRHAVNRLAIAFCVSIAHAQSVADTFAAAGIQAEVLDGSLSTEERRARVARFRARETMVLASCELVSEGFDCPNIEAALLLRPTQSLCLYIQQVGRALRPSDSKSEALILDHAGNCHRHGLPDEPRRWELTQDKPKRVVVPALQTCRECYAVLRKTVTVCPVCDAILATQAQQRARKLHVREGDLVEVSAIREMPYKQLLATARTREQLEVVAAARGYSRGWVRQILRARGDRSA